MSGITTESGSILTTEDGFILEADTPTTNADIQLFDFNVYLLRAIIWQYTNAENLQSLLTQKAAWYTLNQTQFWQDFLTNVFNLKTANEFGLSVWSIILNLPLFINNGYNPDLPTFGFDGAGGDVNFDNGILQDENGSTYNLPLEIKRIALRLRFYQLVSSGTVPETNRMLKDVFSSYGQCYLIDYGDMTQGYVFNFPVPASLAYLFNNVDILPRPAGVQSSWIDATLDYFGFDSNHLNFDNGILQ